MGHRNSPPAIVNQASTPWPAQQNHLGQLFATARNLAYDHPPRTYYPGQTYEPFSAQENEAMHLGTIRARSGSPATRAAQAELEKILGGGYLRDIQSGPIFQGAVEAAQRQVLPQVRSAAPRGRSDSPTARQQEVRALTDVFANHFFKQYGNERQNMMGALGLTPALSGLDYKDLAALSAIGESARDMGQTHIDEQIARHNFAQEEPYQRLRDYQNFIMGNYGGNTSQQSFPIRGSRLSSALGGMIGGAGAGAQMGGPFGAAAGGQLGLLAGLFG